MYVAGELVIVSRKSSCRWANEYSAMRSRQVADTEEEEKQEHTVSKRNCSHVGGSCKLYQMCCSARNVSGGGFLSADL